MRKWFLRIIYSVLALLSLYLIVNRKYFLRLDLTQDNRYSISDCTYQTLESLDQDISITVYLGGRQDANFVRLRRSFEDLVETYKLHTSHSINYELQNPVGDDLSEKQRYAIYQKLESRGLKGMSVADYSASGELTQRIIFPWAEISNGKQTLSICLMQPNEDIEGEKAINAAISQQEYLLTDAIRVLARKQVSKIALLEGHDELTEAQTYDFTVAASRYFQVDRGVIGNDASILDSYSVVVVAGPQSAFSEKDKFVIDQYIMHGGKVLWLVDGIKMSAASLAKSGSSAMISNPTNLQDMLFKYGVRIEANLVEDMQCISMPINIARPGEKAQFKPVPWLYSPLFQVSPYHVITKMTQPIMGSYASSLSFTNSNDSLLQKEVLLISSNATHLEQAPGEIDIRKMLQVDKESYFNYKYVPIAACISGCFTSVFEHRLIPEGIKISNRANQSESTRMIVVSDGDIIANALDTTQNSVRVMPLGYDRVAKRTWGNKSFLVNCLLYLTDDVGMMDLRKRELKLRLLNRSAVRETRVRWILFNLGLPFVYLLLLASISQFVRKKMYR